MKIGIIGLGDIAQKAYLPVITQLATVEPVLCTRNRDTLAALARQYHVRETCTDYRELINSGVDAVMVHSATHSHPEIAAYFLKQGIPVFVDKPLADSAAACEQLYELAARYRQPLYVGFNRRHLPLLNQHLPGVQNGQHSELRALRWEKNRHNLPGELRTFIFDDFIHPLDSINIGSKADIKDAHIRWQKSGDQVSRIDIEWQLGETLLQASMDRNYGVTNEVIEARYDNRSYRFDSFGQGRVMQEGQTRTIREKDWTPMLETKGFVPMLKDWLDVVENGKMDEAVVTRNLASHQLAESLCQDLAQRL